MPVLDTAIDVSCGDLIAAHAHATELSTTELALTRRRMSATTSTWPFFRADPKPGRTNQSPTRP